MTLTLFPHQERGADFLAKSEGTKGLFFGMGTGKTITSIIAYNRSTADALLVIAPPIALPMWAEELTKYGKIEDEPAEPGAQVQILKTGSTKIKDDATMLVVSYAIATNRAQELSEWLAQGRGALICDESHALKSVKAKRTKAILGAGGIASGAIYSWMLTGTPITRWNDDMFPFLCRADLPGMKSRLGGVSMDKFCLRYTIRQKRQFAGARWPVEMVVGNQRTEELADWIYGAGLALRVDLAEVFANMPPLTTNRYSIALDADANLKAQLKAMEKMSIADIRQKLESKEPALATVRRQLGLAKVKAAAAEIAERIESGQNVLVGAWHTEVIDELHAALQAKGYQGAIIDGRTSSTHKTLVQGTWNEGGYNYVLAQIAAAGVSLNLQHGGTQIIVVEEDWSPSIMDQFYARLWRYGQKKHVHVDTLTTETKLDKAVGRISSTKAREHGKFNEVGRDLYEEAS